MEQSESRRSGTPTDTALTKDTEGGVTTIHYGNYIHYCRITDTTQCSGVVTEHMLVYVCSGELLVTERGRSHALRRGDAYILRRNHMCRKTSRSLPDGEPFEGLFFYLTVPMLRRTLTQNAISLRGLLPPPASAYIPLPRHAFLDNLFSTLASYFKSERFPGQRLMELKMQETVLTLIEIEPDLTALLFDFAAPAKSDLRQFMEQYYMQELDLAGWRTTRDARSRHSSRSFPLPSACRRADGSYAAAWRRRAAASCRASGPPPYAPRWDSRASATSRAPSSSSSAYRHRRRQAGRANNASTEKTDSRDPFRSRLSVLRIVQSG